MHCNGEVIESAVNCKIYGDNNTLKGCVNCKIYGDSNTLKGCVNCEIHGNPKNPSRGNGSRGWGGGYTTTSSVVRVGRDDDNSNNSNYRAPKRSPKRSPKQNSALGQAIRQASERQTVRSFVQEDRFNHFRTIIFAAMDETGGWVKLLAARGLLAGEAVEKQVSQLKTQWSANRGGKPTETIILELMHNDEDFADSSIQDFAAELVSLDIKDVNTAVVKLTSFLEDKQKKAKKKNTTAYDAQSELRSWLLQQNICDEEEVDSLIIKVGKEGVKEVSSLDDFTKNDLKDLGFSTFQALALIKAFNQKSH